MNNYRFNAEGNDPTNEGLLIPRYKATGRTAPNGKVYPEVVKENEEELVPVRSIVTKRDGNLNEITPDLLSKNFLRTDTPDNSGIGLSAAQSLGMMNSIKLINCWKGYKSNQQYKEYSTTID